MQCFTNFEKHLKTHPIICAIFFIGLNIGFCFVWIKFHSNNELWHHDTQSYQCKRIKLASNCNVQLDCLNLYEIKIETTLSEKDCYSSNPNIYYPYFIDYKKHVVVNKTNFICEEFIAWLGALIFSTLVLIFDFKIMEYICVTYGWKCWKRLKESKEFQRTIPQANG